MRRLKFVVDFPGAREKPSRYYKFVWRWRMPRVGELLVVKSRFPEGDPLQEVVSEVCEVNGNVVVLRPHLPSLTISGFKESGDWKPEL